MSFPRYGRYKDSGVRWLGEVPEHWRLAPFWTRYWRTKRVGFPEEQLLSAYRDHGVVPKSSRDDNNNKPSDDLTVYQLVNPGDLVINKMKAWQGSVAVSDHRGIVSPAYFVYTPTHSENASYLHHLMRSDRYITGYLSISKGVRIGQWDLDPMYHSRLPLLIPPADEQKSIVDFIESETAKIDALVEEQRQLIELLKEKRQAVISHAVTKGLHPDAPMKNSGVKWIGDIPRGWDVTKVKFAVSEVVDCLHTTPTYDGEPLYPAVRTADIEPGRLLLDQARLVSEEVYRERVQRLEPEAGDIVYSREGERFGMAALVPPGTKLCLGQRTMMFRHNSEHDPSFLMWVLNSSSVYQQVMEGITGPTAPHVNIEEIRNFYIPSPNLGEQNRIATHIDAAVTQIDELIALASGGIDLLQERRSALISAAVTGKIDVRKFAPSDVAELEEAYEPA